MRHFLSQAQSPGMTEVWAVPPRHDLLAERSVCARSLPSSDKPLTSPEGGSAIRGRRGPIGPLSELRV